MKRPALTAIASCLAAVGSALTLLGATGGSSSATPLSVESSAPAPASQTDPVPLPPPASTIEPSPEALPETPAVDAGTGDAAPPPPPPLADDPPPAEKTPRPARAEWKSAPFVGFARATDNRCKARRIREWVLVKCAIPNVDGFSLIAGTRDGVDFWMNTMEFGSSSITFEFPVRRGDRRVFQVNPLAGKYGSSPEVILSERWSEGDPAPLLTVSGAF
jgi:hypothetical protein